MKVIYVGSFNKSEILSGTEKVSKRIFEEYSKIDKTLFICYFQDGKKYSYIKKIFGYRKITSVNGSDILMLGIIRMLYEIQRHNPKIIHILCFNRFVVFLYLLRLFSRVKIFYTLNGVVRHENEDYIKNYLVTFIKNKIVENVIIYASDRIFYLSDYSRSILSIYYSPNISKLSRAVNGLDECFLRLSKIKYPKKNDNTIVFIGNIDHEAKGFWFLLDALLKSKYKTKLYIIDSADKSVRFKLFSNIQISITDKMTPFEMIEYFKDKRIVVSTSKYDTFNTSVLEAISCGLYPILTKQTGLSEIIGGYLSISTFEYGDEKSFLDILLQSQKGKLKHKFIKDLYDFSWKSVLDKYYIPVYEC